MAFTAITVEGGLFPGDLLERLAAGIETTGQRPDDFGFKAGQRLSDEMQAAFSDVRSYWDAFQRRRLKSRDSLTTLTRDFWVIPLLEDLGFSLEYQRRAATAGSGGDTYALSHRAGNDPEAPPVHIIALDQPLDRRGEGRRSPHALVQEYLNRSDALWGLVTNGRQLRLIRDSARLARPTFLEFDLEALVEGNLYSEFVLLYRLLHRSRFPVGAADAPECWLEKYYQQGIEEGGRVREHLREGVEEALQKLGAAFLAHPDSTDLRRAIVEGRLSATEYYRQLLRLIYRLLFLMVAEERRLLFPADAAHPERQAIYTRYYSLGRLRERSERRRRDEAFGDLWLGLRETFRLFRNDDRAGKLGLSALDGELFGPFACADLEGAGCDNASLLTAVFHLSTFSDGRVRRRVNYAGLDVEELGSIYESLLDYHPVVRLNPPGFELVWGSERKQTGSYYTPTELVRELIDRALVPVMEERLSEAGTKEEKERALRSLKVCDPASGSGHFLLAAARRLGRELAKVRTGEEEPAPEAYREAVRDIIRECLYAVDKNPLAVDLCKVALWLEGHFPGLPLSFLDHHLKCGDSLVGVFEVHVLRDGIPDDAYKPVTGDDRQAASQYRRRNQEERERQASLFQEQVARAADGPRALAPDFAALAELAERTPQDVQDKEELYKSLRHSPRWHQLQVTCDLWTAAFFSHLTAPPPGDVPLVPTTAAVWNYLAQGSTNARLEAEAMALSTRHPFFHWPLEFPEVFAAGGFDVVLGNPPWERIKLQEQEFFAGRDYEIATAPNRAARENLILTLPERNPALAAEFALAKHQAEAQSKFVRSSGRFPLCGRGDINTYAVFAELMRKLLSPAGRAGLIVPSGIATDDTTKFFFQDLMEGRSLVSLHDFENRQGIFPGVHRSYKFCLLTLAGAARPPGQGAEFAFFLQQVTDLKDEARRFVLTRDDIALLNPNTRTCPIFRSQKDADLTKAIYQRVPVLIKDGPPAENPWGVKFSTMFHMANDSSLFRTREQLEREGWRLRGNVFHREEEVYLPLYEAKMMHHFDHRWATYEGRDTREVTLREKQDPNFLALPRYWVAEEEVAARSAWAPPELCRAWLLGEAEAVQRALAVWWLGSCLIAGWDLPPVLRALREPLNFTAEKARKMAAEVPLTPAEAAALAAAPELFRLPPPKKILEMAEERLRGRLPRFLLGWRDITNTTNERTVIAGVLPLFGVGDTFLLMMFDHFHNKSITGLVANLSAFSYDYASRQKIGGTHLKFFTYKQLPVLHPTTYDRPCPWSGDISLQDWLAPRVLELTYTAHDLAPFAQDMGFEGPPFPWDEERRWLIRSELDAAFFHLYKLSRKEVDYVMETFPIVKRKDEQRHGEFRTKRLILEIYDDLQQARQSGRAHQSRLSPPPGVPGAAPKL